jgi:hypothetical protein
MIAAEPAPTPGAQRALVGPVERLRAKLERDPQRSWYLIAEPGLGYRQWASCEVVG